MHVSRNPVEIKNLGPIERWTSAAAGAGLLAYGVKKRSPRAGLMALLGGDLFYRGATGYSILYHLLGRPPFQPKPGRSASIPYRQGIRVDKAITIDKPCEELYQFWRNFENFPRVIKHLRSVTRISDRLSHWVAEGCSGKSAEWDAEIVNEEPGQRIGWRSLPGSEFDTAGSVHFKPAPGGRGTEVLIELKYNPTAGALGAAVAKLLGEDPAREIGDDLRRLKQLMETGEIATTAGQPSGREARRRPARARRAKSGHLDRVMEASEESFPASDAPAWTGSRRAS